MNRARSQTIPPRCSKPDSDCGQHIHLPMRAGCPGATTTTCGTLHRSAGRRTNERPIAFPGPMSPAQYASQVTGLAPAPVSNPDPQDLTRIQEVFSALEVEPLPSFAERPRAGATQPGRYRDI